MSELVNKTIEDLRFIQNAGRYPQKVCSAAMRGANLLQKFNNETKNEWISTETRWPNIDIKIIGIDMNQDEPYIFESEWEDGFWTNIGGEEFTHWMPSPELPK